MGTKEIHAFGTRIIVALVVYHGLVVQAWEPAGKCYFSDG